MSASEAETAEKIGTSVKSATVATGAVQIISGFVLQAGLGQLWSMLNYLQVHVYVPMLDNLKFPPSTMIITRELIKIAKFELIPTEKINEELWYFPEGEAFSLNFETAGVESKLFLENIGTILYLVLLNFVCMLVHLILWPLRNTNIHTYTYIHYTVLPRL